MGLRPTLEPISTGTHGQEQYVGVQEGRGRHRGQRGYLIAPTCRKPRHISVCILTTYQKLGARPVQQLGACRVFRQPKITPDPAISTEMDGSITQSPELGVTSALLGVAQHEKIREVLIYNVSMTPQNHRNLSHPKHS